MPPISPGVFTPVNAIDFSSLPAELKSAAIDHGYMMPTYMLNAMELLVQDIDVIPSDGKTPLYTWELQDMIKKAEDAFVPNSITKLVARTPTLVDYEIDTNIARSELISIYRNYTRHVMGLKTLDEALTANFAIHFLQHAMQKLIIEKIALKAIWGGVRTVTQTDRGADKALTGFVAKFTAGRGVGGDIPAGNVFESEPITESNAVAQVNGPAQLAYNNPDLAGIPLFLYCSPQTYQKYNINRVADSNGSLQPGTQSATPDYMPNIYFKPQHGLSGKDTIVITPKSNLKFCVNEDPTNFNTELRDGMKVWELNIMASGGVEYAYGPAVYLNEEV